MGTLLNPTYGSLKGDLIERVYIPKGPPHPNLLGRRKDADSDADSPAVAEDPRREIDELISPTKDLL